MLTNDKVNTVNNHSFISGYMRRDICWNITQKAIQLWTCSRARIFTSSRNLGKRDLYAVGDFSREAVAEGCLKWSRVKANFRPAFYTSIRQLCLRSDHSPYPRVIAVDGPVESILSKTWCFYEPRGTMMAMRNQACYVHTVGTIPATHPFARGCALGPLRCAYAFHRSISFSRASSLTSSES